MIFNFYIIKKITFQKLFATHQFGKRCYTVFGRQIHYSRSGRFTLSPGYPVEWSREDPRGSLEVVASTNDGRVGIMRMMVMAIGILNNNNNGGTR
jgi:hypothetical protein